MQINKAWGGDEASQPANKHKNQPTNQKTKQQTPIIHHTTLGRTMDFSNYSVTFPESKRLFSQNILLVILVTNTLEYLT